MAAIVFIFNYTLYYIIMVRMAKKTKSQKWVWWVIGVFILALVTIGLSSKNSEESGFNLFFPQNKIAVLELVGEIAPSSGGLFATGSDIEVLIDDIESIDSNSAFSGLLLKINSPGGTVVSSRSIVEALNAFSKPSVCWLGDAAASGAYWIASACDRIVSDPLSITGSIGATASFIQYAGYLEKEGIKYEEIVSGTAKEAGSPYKELSETDREKIQYIVDESFKYFLDDIVKSRNLTEEQAVVVKTGDIFLGKDAIEIGLVDELGTFRDAKKVIEDLVGGKAVFVQFQKSNPLAGFF